MTEHRALQHLHDYGRRFPGVWDAYAKSLYIHRSQGVAWPEWCYAPLLVMERALAGGRETIDMQIATWTAPLGCLAAWRATQGIYRLHPTLLAELLGTPVDDEVPSDALTRMPEWCVYVELHTPDHHGFFAHLEYDPGLKRREQQGLLPYVIFLDSGSLRDGLEQALAEQIH